MLNNEHFFRSAIVLYLSVKTSLNLNKWTFAPTQITQPRRW